jgi:PAS domain S-box-containing protein
MSSKKYVSFIHVFFIILILMTTLSITIIGYLWISSEYNRFQERSVDNRSDYIEARKAMIKGQVNSAVDYIEYNSAQTEKRLKDDIKQRTYEAHAIATNIYSKFYRQKNRVEIADLIKEALRPIRFNDGRGYYFAVSMDGVEQLYPIRPEFEGVNLLDLKDSKGRFVIRDEIAIIKESGEGFIADHWPKPDEDPAKAYAKISFVKYFEHLDWYFGTGEYLDDVTKEIQKEVLDRISKIRFGKDGYLFAGQFDGVSLMGPAVGQNMLEISDAEGVKIVKSLIEAAQRGGDYVQYVMPKFEGLRPAPKISYAREIKDWQWYVGAGLYVDEIDQVIAKDKIALKKNVQRQILKIIITLMGLVIVLIVIARIVSKQAQQSILAFNLFFEKAAKEAATIDPQELRFSEFSKLANSANRMIDERRAMESELRESRERWRAIINNALIGVYQVNKEGRFILVNPKFAEMFGYKSPVDFLESVVNVTELYVDPLERKQNLNMLDRQGFLDRSEVRFLHRDGREIWVQATARVLHANTGEEIIEGFITDISERVQVEWALRESEERYRVLVELSPDAVIVHRESRIIYINQAGIEMLGAASSSDLIGRNVLDFIHPEHHEIVKQRIEKIQFEKQPLARLEEKYRRIDGQIVHVVAAGTFIQYDGLPAALSVISDITAIKDAEVEKRKLESELHQAQKMESIGTLAGGIAHDFNNLLMGIQGRTSLIMAELDSYHHHLEHLHEIEKYVKSATELTRQLLGFARGGKYEVKPVDLNDLIVKSSEMFGRTRKEITIYRKTQPDIWTVEADRSQIEQVLLNLYVNAWQAMAGGGEISIETENVNLDDAFVAPYSVPAGNYVKISVSDSGMGIAADIQERIFDPFFTTKQHGRGTGLGLASAYGIIKNHDGIITVSSQVGHGATFTFYLPASQKSLSAQEPSTPGPLRGTGTILMIDDEKLILDVGVQMLSGLGYTVWAAEDGHKGLEIYAEKQAEIDLVILDLIMPKFSGENVFDQLKGIDPNAKVLLSSGYSMDGHAKTLMQRGCDGFIQKPFTLNEISHKISEILRSTTTDLVDDMK